MVADRTHDKDFMTVEEYLELNRRTPDARYEYIRGYAHLLAGGTSAHAMLAVNISSLLHQALRRGPCAVYSSDALVQVAEDAFFFPDVTVSCSEADRDGEVIHSPRVIIEILSPSTRVYDQSKKFFLYQECPTVEAVMFVESTAPAAITVFQKEGNVWPHMRYYEGDLIKIRCLDLYLTVDDIYEGVHLHLKQ